MSSFLIGAALQKISQDPEIARTMFEVLETEKIVEGEADITLIPARNELLAQLMAAAEPHPRTPTTPPTPKSAP